MDLKEILKNIDFELKAGKLNKDITEIKYDSRKIEKNNLFIAISGFKKDGHQYIPQALENGASTVIIEKEISEYQANITYLKVENSRKTMAIIAKNFFKDPLQDIKLIGVTGTNGKTTTSYLLYNILKEAANKSALFGTIKNIVGNKKLDASRTTPESIDLYRYFAQMRKEGIHYGVMEVSSHALDLYRVYGMDFAAAVFTNISPEHLDYHQNLKKYREVKSRLFSQLKSDRAAIINLDDKNGSYIKEKSQAKNYSYSLDSKSADLYTTQFTVNQKGIEYQTAGLLNCKFKSKLGGIFNIYNSLAAILTAHLLGIDKKTIKKAFSEISSVPGRFEIINAGQNFQIVVDFAHTPDGMQNVLQTAAVMKKNRLIVLFGCGGDRDRSKRPAMAKLAAEYADYIILTNDNPRTEDPGKIFKEIQKGFAKDFNNYEIIADRKKAINKAIKIAEKNDFIMLLGRGHEKYQVLGEEKIELDDRKAAYQAAEKRKGL